MMRKYPRPLLSMCVGMLFVVQNGFAQQTIANPLVRPAGMGSAAGTASVQAPVKADPNAGQPPPAAVDLRDKAASRLSQEDFNLKQQALNAPTVPAPLSALFSQMSVSAFVGGVVVMRRADFVASSMSQQAVQQTSSSQGGGQSNNGGGRGGAGAVQAGGVVVTSSVLRLNVGQNTNLNGYVLRARVEGMDVFVDWKNELGAWVSVFFGALESAPNLALTPAKDSLEKVDTSSFDYLKPQVSSRIISTSNNQGGAGNNQGGGFNSGFNGGGSGSNGSAPSF